MTWKLGLWAQYSTHVPLKVAQIDICNGKPVEFFFFLNHQRPEFQPIWGAQSDPKIGPLSPMFSTPLKVLTMSMWSNTDMKPVKTFGENDQRLEFWLSGSKIGPLRPILYTSKSSYNGYVKQCWSETIGNFLRKWLKTTSLYLFGGPKFGHLGPYYTHLWKYSSMSI